MSLPLREHPLTTAEEHLLDEVDTSPSSSRSPEIDREFAQILALIAVAERERQFMRSQSFTASVALVLSVSLVLLNLDSVLSGASITTAFVTGVVGVLVAMVWGVVMLFALRQTVRHHRRAAAETGETIREVISSTDWEQKLDPLEWALLRTRVAQLDLVDLSSLR